MQFIRPLVLLTLPIVAGCVTDGFSPGKSVQAYLKPGTTRAERQVDRFQCQLASVQQVPTSLRTASSPGYSTPGSVSCSTYAGQTTCNQIGGDYVSGSVRTYDANSALRERFIEVCMTGKGYSTGTTKMCMTREDTTTEDCVIPDKS